MLDKAMLLALVNIGVAVILIAVLAMILKINRKKFAIGAALLVIYAGISIYYVCLVRSYPRSVLKQDIVTVTVPLSEEHQIESEEEETDFMVVILYEDETFSLAPDGEIEVKKGGRFKIEKVIYKSADSEGIKADIKGFAGNARRNDQQDIGYWVTYANMLKYWAMKGEKDKFEVQIKEDNDLLGTIYIQFID